MTTMKTSRQTLDRLRPYAVFRDSWDTALNNALDMLEEIRKEAEQKKEIQDLFK